MTDRHEFTAPDGSRRWCSRELYRYEFAHKTIRHGGWDSDTANTAKQRRRLLKPQPSGLRWWIRGRVWSLDVDEDLRGVVIPVRRKWEAWEQRSTGDSLVTRGTLAECAHALKAAVTK